MFMLIQLVGAGARIDRVVDRQRGIDSEPPA